MLTTQNSSDENMLDISQIFITSQIETTEKINREKMTIDSTI